MLIGGELVLMITAQNVRQVSDFDMNERQWMNVVGPSPPPADSIRIEEALKEGKAERGETCGREGRGHEVGGSGGRKDKCSIGGSRREGEPCHELRLPDQIHDRRRRCGLEVDRHLMIVSVVIGSRPKMVPLER